MIFTEKITIQEIITILNYIFDTEINKPIEEMDCDLIDLYIDAINVFSEKLL